MPQHSTVCTDSGKGDRRTRSLVQRNTSDAAARLVAATELMGSGETLVLPRLADVPLEHSLCAGDEPAIALAKALLKLDIAVAEDWEKAKHDPTTYVGLTLARWIANHGSDAIKRRFDLTAALTSCLDDYGDREPANPNLLYITVDAGSAADIEIAGEGSSTVARNVL